MLKAQMDKHLHTMVYGEFLQDIQVCQSRTCTTFAMMRCTLNSGAEAIDAAPSYQACHRTFQAFAVSGGYHGNTRLLSVSSNEARKAPFRPLLLS